jgi:hypothetical protein
MPERTRTHVLSSFYLLCDSVGKHICTFCTVNTTLDLLKLSILYAKIARSLLQRGRSSRAWAPMMPPSSRRQFEKLHTRGVGPVRPHQKRLLEGIRPSKPPFLNSFSHSALNQTEIEETIMHIDRRHTWSLVLALTSLMVGLGLLAQGAGVAQLPTLLLIVYGLVVAWWHTKRAVSVFEVQTARAVHRVLRDSLGYRRR